MRINLILFTPSDAERETARIERSSDSTSIAVCKAWLENSIKASPKLKIPSTCSTSPPIDINKLLILPSIGNRSVRESNTSLTCETKLPKKSLTASSAPSVSSNESSKPGLSSSSDATSLTNSATLSIKDSPSLSTLSVASPTASDTVSPKVWDNSTPADSIGLGSIPEEKVRVICSPDSRTSSKLASTPRAKSSAASPPNSSRRELSLKISGKDRRDSLPSRISTSTESK